MDAITTHNPFAINDICFSGQTGYPLEKVNSPDPGQNLGRDRKAAAVTPERRPQAIFRLPKGQFPALADPFPEADPLSAAARLYLG